MHARCEDRIQDPAAQIWSLEAENARKGARILDLINKRADRDARQTRELGTAPQECARLMQEFTEYEKNVALDDTRRSEETAAVARKNTDFSQELSDMDVYRRRLEDENACLKQEAQDNTGYALRETSLTQRVEELEQCLTTREEHYHQELEKKDAYNGRLQDENAHLKQGNAGFLLRAESLTQCAKELERRLATCYEQHCEKLNENAHLKQQAQGNVLRAESLAQDVEVLKRRLATREEQHRGELKEKDEYNSRLEDEHARLKQGGTDLVLRMSSLTQRMTEFQRHLTTCDEQHREELKEKDACNRRLEDENAYLKQQAQGNADCVLREASLVRGMERLEQLLAACEEEHRRELEKKDTLIQILENDKAATQIRCSGLQLRADNARAEAGVLATTVRSLSSAFASADSVLGHSSKMLEITQSQLADALARIEALEPVARELDVLKHELASLKGDLQCLDGVQGDKMACFPAHQRERGALAERFDVELPMVHDPTQQEKGLKHNAAESDNEDSKMLGYVDHGGHEALEAVMVDNWTQQEKEVKHAVAESDDEGSKMLGRVDYEGREDLEATMVDDPTRQEKGPNHTAAESDDVQSVRQPFLARLDEQVGEGEVCISEKPELTTENSGNREFGSRPSGEIDDIGDFAVVDEAQKLQPVCTRRDFLR
ncbi:hypothetical protein OBBRIDRAFT_106702 [Obba rivulosa]|uniref:Uncharacterized protein n=1 Tax=Obba rivulosa TaxID=1052685 RepID=A0A8E2DHH7_9APHY|nr:hypothetical protein OBBRIDRAFT_106702 [Obba rivulosa]